MTTRTSRRIVAAFALFAMVTLLATHVIRAWPRPPLAAGIPSSSAILDANGRLLRLTLASDQQYRLRTTIDKVAPELVEALLLHEDRRFYRHCGVDPAALVRAAFATYGGGRRQGGSTLTMQLARLLYGINTRTWGGKARQMVLAVGLELRYSKAELLETHLNLMPYGGNVQGVSAASLIYFGKQPRDLALAESLALVVIPQSPAIRNPSRATEPPALATARRRLFDRWREAHPQARVEEESMRAALRFEGPRSLPFEAPHFVDSLHASEPIVRTTLDLPTQRAVERVVQGFVREQERVGIRNAAALLVDSRDMSVRAAIGSARFFDDSIAGQVNGTLARRSPGSALKPFIYALAIDQGLIHPLTVLKDAPTAFGPFSPENFDGRFVGPVTATEALVRSRNIPAVALSARLAQPGFYQFLRAAGVSRMESERHYGLALALGGGEVTMEEIAQLYAMLANQGKLRPLRYRVEDEPMPDAPRLISEQSSFLVLDMLAQNTRPDDSTVKPRGHVPVAWKTGTSWAFRDAWTAGVFGPYVLVVWVGNFDGSGNPAFVGVQAAAPLFFRIVDAVRTAEPDLASSGWRVPAGLERIEVCAASGELPNAECPRTASAWFIPGKSPIRVSDVHRRVWIDERTGDQACPPYDAAHVRSEVYEFWPSDVLELFARAGVPRRRPPPLAECSQERFATRGAAPRISSPLSNATYTLRAGREERESIPLAATADADVRRLHWFVDTAYVGTGTPGIAVAWLPRQSGTFIVRAVDDSGRADSRELRVAVVP